MVFCALEFLGRQNGAEFILSSNWTYEIRSIPANEETSVHHIDERPWKCTI